LRFALTSPFFPHSLKAGDWQIINWSREVPIMPKCISVKILTEIHSAKWHGFRLMKVSYE
jgi:hypothetical protein